MLNILSNKGLDLQKETHQGKSYLVHVEECRRLAHSLMEKVYNYPPELIRFSLLLCELHDLGKLLPKWKLDSKGRPFHAIEGSEWLLRENLEINLSPEYRKILLYAIMTHHSPLLIGSKLREVIERAEKLSADKRSFNKYTECRKLININEVLDKLEKNERRALADAIGIVKIADILSAKGISIHEILTQYSKFNISKDEIRNAIIKRAYERNQVFDSSKFEKQFKIASLREKYLLVAAPTGWGKTTLALLRMSTVKPIKIFYVLPTITAIKDFYDFFVGLLNQESVGEYFYFADVDLLEKDFESEIHPLETYRYFIPKITITTIDQLLLTIIQVGRYYARRFNLKNSLIILDEFHLLTPEMIAILRMFLKEFAENYNLSCLIMSATPSPLYEDLLREVVPQLKSVILDEEYRSLKRHKICYINEKYIDELITENEDLIRKRRTLILVNTVSKAQRLYELIKNIFESTKKVVLLHGDFAYKDRVNKEKEVKNADILVSTQVAEVSLDISFDLLITELAPIPSLIQRFGRVNRYGLIHPPWTNVYVCKPRGKEPYGLLIDLASEVLSSLISGIEREGEATYLKREFWLYEQQLREEVERFEEEVSEKISIMKDFFSFLVEESKMLRKFGREERWLAIPLLYLDNALTIFKELQITNKYQERAKLYAEIKKYLVPASYTDIKKAKWDYELRVPVIENYDEELGIIR